MAPSPQEAHRNREIPLSNHDLIKEKSEESETRDLYTALITEAPYISGDENELVPLEEIPWFDKSLIEESIAFHRKYFTLVLLSNTFALMYGFAVKPNSAVLLRTGKLHDPELSFHRYLSTIQRIGKFFMFPFDEEKAYKAFKTVRKMHSLASKKRAKSEIIPEQNPYVDKCNEAWKTDLCKAMSKDLAHIDTSSAPKHMLTWNPPVPVSQFDMAVTQFGFIGTMWLFPRVFGIKDRLKEMRGVVHTWAVFGRLLGIKDEYNVCIKPDSDLYDKLFLNIVVESLKTMDETVITIQHAFTEAFTKRVPFMTYRAMLFFGLQELDGYKGENLWKLMSWTDKLSLQLMRLWIWTIRTSIISKFFTHLLTGIWMQVQFWLHLTTSLWD